MSTDKVRCLKCKGQGKYLGMGGIEKDCGTCDGKGKVDIQPKEVAFVQVGDIKPMLGKVTTSCEPDTVDMFEQGHTEMCSLEDIFPGVTEGVASMKIDAESFEQTLPKKKETQSAPIDLEPLPVPVVDPMMEAILAEPSMDPFMWAKKYQGVPGLFVRSIITGQMEEAVSKVARAGMRATYASQQQIAPRIVNMAKSQDAVAKTDADYKAYAQQEKMRTEKKDKR